jgi:large repetitive protein
VVSGCVLLTDLGGLSGGAPDAVDATSPPPDAGSPDAPEADTLASGRGSGKDGPLEVSTSLLVNGYAAIEAIAPAGSRVLTVDATVEIAAGSAVMVWQTAGLSPPAPGQSVPVTPEAVSPLGRYSLARVVSIDATRITLDRPLPFGVLATGAQVVRIPEHTDVVITAAGSIAAKPWDGRKGGVVALLARGAVTNDGAIHADAAGFRGGQGFGQSAFVGDCAAPAGTIDGGFSARGEGLATTAYAPDPNAEGAVGGFGNVANGGGGGNCHNAGGGGGGNGGAGGVGGASYDGARLVGGRGGVPVVSGLAERLWLGGGGGAGHGDGAAGEVVAAGGAGGGVVLMRAASVTGSGVIRAEGAPGGASLGNGAGGGGAGGSLLVTVDGAFTCTGLSVRGGAGGAARGTVLLFGPGGGGAGGRARVTTGTSACVPDTAGGISGLCEVDGGASSARGAAAGSAGVVE